MPSSASDFASRRFSTASLPERQRLSFWRDFFGQEIVHCDIEVERDVSLRAEATLVAIAGIARHMVLQGHADAYDADACNGRRRG